MIIIYFENSSHAEVVARYDTEEEYMSALPELKKRAEASNMEITEIVIAESEAENDR